MKNTGIVTRTTGIVLALLLLTGVSGARDAVELSDDQLSGIWQGTIHIADQGLSAADQHVLLELGEDGSFYCPTHDLITMKRDSPSVGWIEREDHFIDFSMETETGTRSHVFQLFFVAGEERSLEVPPKIYLHDVINGVHIHLAPYVEGADQGDETIR